MDPIRATDIRQHNTMAVLSAIYSNRDSGISQTDVVNKLGLKAPSVFRIFTILEQEGYIKTCDNRRSFDATQKGRHPLFYTVVPDALYTIGVEFWSSYVSIGVFDFTGKNVLSEYEYLNENLDADSVLDIICEKIFAAIEKLNLKKEHIAGVGIAAPGKVCVTDGSIVFYPRIKDMVNYPLGEKLRNSLDLDIVIHNNCACVASSIYAKYYEENTDKSVFTYLIRGGVNGSLITKNGIYTEVDNTTIEVGHVSLDLNGPECMCGLKGCLEGYIKSLDAEYCAGEKSSVYLFGGIKDYSLPESVECLRKAANYFFYSMKAIQRWFGPDEFAFVCPDIELGQELIKYIREIYKNSFDLQQKKIPRMYAAVYNNSLAQVGACNLVLNKFFGI